MSSPTYEPQPQRSGLTTALVAGAIIALICANIYLYVQINNLRTDLASAQDALKTQSAQLGSLRESSSVSAAAQAQHIEALKQDLETTRAQARTMSSQAKAEALAHADQLTKQIEAEQAGKREIPIGGAPHGDSEPAGKRQDEAKGVLGDRVLPVGGHVAHGDAGLCACGQVDVVEPGRPGGD